MAGRYHIPFPSNFLAVNTPNKKAGGQATTLPPREIAPHSFLSNNPARTGSVSSETPTTGPVKEALSQPQNFLALNTKHTTTRAASVDTSPGSMAPHNFLSNKPDISRRPSA